MNKLHLFWMLFVTLIFTELLSYTAEPDCEVRKFYTFFEFQDNKLSKTDSIVIQINNRSGEEYGQIEIPFSKSNPIVHLEAWIEDTNGVVIRQLKKQEYVDVSAIADYSLYEDDFVRKFTLKHNVYPHRICYTYKTVFKHFLNIAKWVPVIDTDIPTHQATLVFRCPENYRINISERNIGPPEISNTTAGIIRTWHASYDGSVSSEVYCPLLNTFLPSVTIVPLNFTYGLDGSNADWKSFGEWQWNLIQGLRELPESEKRKISGIIGQTKDKNEIVRKLYHYLQDNTRYINVTLDIGGMKPYPAEYVATNKFGDCKALTNYMMAMLDYAGIKSYYTTLELNLQPKDIIEEIPFQQFNHVVLTVPIEKDTLWLENTSNTTPFGYAGVSIQNRLALLVDDGRSRLIRVPSLQEADVRESRRMEFTLDVLGNAKVYLRSNFRGYKFELYNSLLTQFNNDVQNTYVHDHLPFPSFELQDWRILKKNRDARDVTLESSVSIQHILKSLGKEQYFSVMPVEIPDFTSPKKRKLPVQLPYPVYITDTLIYHLPAGYDKITVPLDTALVCKYGRYQVNFQQEGNSVTVLRDFLLHPGFIPVSEYGDFYNFLIAVKADEERKIIIHL